MTLNDEQIAQLDRWWQRLDADERAELIEYRHDELSADLWRTVMNAEPLEPDQPPIIAVVSDARTGRFRLPPVLAEYTELKANSAT
jgi:hypothetical protein